MRLLRTLPLMLPLLAVAQASLAEWFTVTGDPDLATNNVVQVDPAPVTVEGPLRTMKLRVNRSAARTSWDGVRYQSYNATVLIDCGMKTARYQSVEFYQQPLWTGDVARANQYARSAEPRWMEFRQMLPNPTQRIIRAACGNAEG